MLIFGASGGVGELLKQTYPDALCPTHDEVDISDYSSLSGWASENNLELWNRPLTIINAVGKYQASFLHRSSIDDWYEVLDTNVKGAYNIMRCFLPLMREKQWGRIIHLSSISAFLPENGISAYSCSKSALTNLVKVAAKENAKLGVTINTIALAMIDGGIATKQLRPDILEALRTNIPMQRGCTKQELIHAVQFLQQTPYYTGQELVLAGGLV
jgi:NAD(P)-dependent dehydrogenase (short-subunit alcohol dehydrogenase family)